MTTRKNYNSIVFLTTLSVYLGLVLVGAPAHVYSQTSGQDEKTQIFVGQNLYGNAIFELVAELEKLSKKGKYKWTEKVDLSYDFAFTDADKSPTFMISGSRGNKFVANLLDFTAEKISRDLSKLENVYFNKPDRLGSFEIPFVFEKKDLAVKVKTSHYNWEKDAQKVADIFNSYLRQQTVVKQNEPIGKIYENTKATFTSTQVLIETRLPRGSLDALIAKDAQ
jgi:hypothetical protein